MMMMIIIKKMIEEVRRIEKSPTWEHLMSSAKVTP